MRKVMKRATYSDALEWGHAPVDRGLSLDHLRFSSGAWSRSIDAKQISARVFTGRRGRDASQLRQDLFTEDIYPPVHWSVEGIVSAEFVGSHQLAREATHGYQ